MPIHTIRYTLRVHNDMSLDRMKIESELLIKDGRYVDGDESPLNDGDFRIYSQTKDIFHDNNVKFLCEGSGTTGHLWDATIEVKIGETFIAFTEEPILIYADNNGRADYLDNLNWPES